MGWARRGLLGRGCWQLVLVQMQILPAERSALAGIAAFVWGSDNKLQPHLLWGFCQCKDVAKDYIPRTLLHWQWFPGRVELKSVKMVKLCFLCLIESYRLRHRYHWGRFTAHLSRWHRAYRTYCASKSVKGWSFSCSVFYCNLARRPLSAEWCRDGPWAAAAVGKWEGVDKNWDPVVKLECWMGAG